MDDETDELTGIETGLGATPLLAGTAAPLAFDLNVQSEAVRALLDTPPPGSPPSGSPSTDEAGTGPVPGRTDAPAPGAEPDLDLLIESYLAGGIADATLAGGAGDDDLAGSGSAEYVVARGGDDSVTGAAGDDLIIGDSASDAAPRDYDTLVAQSGAVGFFRFEEGSGGQASDAVAGNHGSLKKGAAFDSDHAYDDSAGSVSFDGRNDYLEIAHDDAYELETGYVQVWFKPDDLGGTQGLFSKDSSGYDHGGHLDIGVSGSGSIEVRLQSGSQSHTVSSGSGAASDGAWTHVVFGWGDGGMKLYVDGQLVDSDSYAGGIEDNEEPISIGASSQYTGNQTAWGVSNFFDGEIDAVSIHAGAVDDAAVAAFFAAASGIAEAPGDDLLFGADGDDIVVGGAGDDRLQGGAGDDLLAGQAGDDLLVGDSLDSSGGGAGTGSVETNVIEVRLGGTSYQPDAGNSGGNPAGDPYYVIRADGEIVAEGYVTWARSGPFDSSDDASWQSVTVNWPNDGTKPDNVSVEFTNDAYGGTAATDRNLHVDSITVNGSRYDLGWSLNSAGTQSQDTSGANDPVTLETSTVTRTVVDSGFDDGGFDDGDGGFAYEDDAFAGTDQPAYASGSASGGAIHVDLGGVNEADAAGMSGGWTTEFALDGDAVGGTLTFSYRLDASEEFESDEYAAVLVSVDGELVSTDGSGVVATVAGGGDTGWRTVTIELDGLAAGQHTLTLGGGLSKKTTTSEAARVSFDDVTLNYAVATAGEVLAGDDTLLGGEGDDALYGNGGADSLYGGSGDDSLFGGAGNDALAGGEGDDLIEGNGGDDHLVGGLGDDLLHGDANVAGDGASGAGDFTALASGNGLAGSLYYGFTAADAVKARQHIDQHEADATFTSTTLDYPQGGRDVQSDAAAFLGKDAGSLSGGGSTTFEHVALHLQGWIYIPEGTHTFSISSDDGFELRIGGEQVALFDGHRGFAETTGSGTYAEGLYQFDLVYWEHSGAEGLEVGSSFSDGPLGAGNFYQSIEDAGLQLTWVETGDGTGYYVAGAGDAGGDAGSDAPGNDVIEGGDGSDTIYGNEAHDTLYGGAGGDVIYGDGGSSVAPGAGAGGEPGFPSDAFPTYGHALSNVVLYLAGADGAILKVKIKEFDDCGPEVHDLDDLPLAGFLATEYAGYTLVAATVKAGSNGDPDVASGEGQLVVLDQGYDRGDLPLASKSYDYHYYSQTLATDRYDEADAAARAGSDEAGGDVGSGESGPLGPPGNDVIEGGDGDDTIFGNEAHDTLYGGAGDDLVYGDTPSSGNAWSGTGGSTSERVFESAFEGADDDFEPGPFDGWSSTDGKIEIRYGEGVDGSDAVELNADPGNHYPDAADIHRQVTTEAGATYTLDFSYAARPGYDATVARFQVLVDGQVVGTFSADGSDDSSPQYRGGSISFTGSGGSQTISFVAAGVEVDQGRGAFIDDVSLTATSETPPETVGNGGLPGRDVLDGGLGDDTLVGNEDDDTLAGGAGDDVLIGDGGFVGAGTVSGRIDASNFGDYVSGTSSTTGGPATVAWVDSSVGNGFGVQPEQNDSSPVQEETGFNPESYRSEALTVDFGLGVQTATVELAAFFVDNGSANPEVAQWQAYREGELVGAGVVQQTGGSTATLEIDLGGALFDTLQFRGETYGRDYYNQGVGDDSSDFLISRIDWTAPAGSEAEGFGEVVGAAGDDTLTGGDGADRLFGNQEDDILDGGAGDDLLSGGRGNDFLDGWYGDDTVIGGAGDDTIMWDSADSYIRGGSGHDTLVGYQGDDWIFLDDANFGMGQIANGGIEVVDLGHGNNFLVGDAISQGDTSLTVTAGDGSDWISTWGNGDDVIAAGGGELDQVWGGAGDDRIYGGAGVDYIYGGAGSDTLVGGSEYDVYYVGRGDGQTQIVDDGGPNDLFGETRDGNGLVLFWGYNDFSTYEGVGSEDDPFAVGDTLLDASQVAVRYDDTGGRVLVTLLEGRDSDNGGATVAFDYGAITALNLWDVAGGGTAGYEPWVGERDITRFEWDAENNRFVFQGLDLGI